MAHQNHDPFREIPLRPRPIDAVVTPFARFMSNSASGGLVLLACAIAAMLLANSPLGHAYHEFWTGFRLSISAGNWTFPPRPTQGHLEWWVNDALMAIFFFVIGLEIKREILTGELRNPRQAALPIVAAVGGMLVPGVIYAGLNWGGESMRGWAIPTATDIAFSLGVLAVLGRRVPHGIRVYLATLAVADDLGALLIIAIFYTSPDKLDLPSLGIALGIVAVMAGLNVMGVRRWWIYGIIGLGLWYFVLQSGIHPTIAGVLAAICIPASVRVDGDVLVQHARRYVDDLARDPKDDHLAETQGRLRALERLAEAAQTPLQRLERGMAPLAAFFVAPVFALANAGVSVGDVGGRALRDPEAWGIVLGLTAGKMIGIVGASYIAVRIGLSTLPKGATWRHIIGAAQLGGIGFTMSLFIAHLAFGPGDRLDVAKLAVLVGSAASALVGVAILIRARPAPETTSE